ncbi:MAG: DKNYY domain-containing protein [Gammaproteobacteria bacterium]|nr:DKNYY domain-containing protein [Gammaproteobacteria bacterium]
MRIVFILLISIFISGCTSFGYHVTDEDVIFEIRSWNNEPINKNMEMACSTTFENLGDGYGVDGHSVFYKGYKIPKADPETFEKLKRGYSKDAQFVYWFTCRLTSAKPSEFEILGGSWAKDNQSVYHGQHLIQADAKSFHFLGENWAADKMSAYHALSLGLLGCESNKHPQVKTFDNVDTGSFKVIGGSRAKDKRMKYNAPQQTPNSGSAEL